MSHKLDIHEGAVVIADAHYSPSRPELLSLIEAIANKTLATTQLILMGDIFDNLFGSISHTYKENQRMIVLLKQISEEIEVIYLEGNHDFYLRAIFKNMKIFPISQQPCETTYKDKKVLLAHGDFDAPFGYQVYTFLIRNPFVLFVLKLIDNITNHSIINYVQRHLDKKEDCREFRGFKELIKKRIENRFDCDYFIEGHFHQNRSIKLENINYINLGAFACNQRYFIVKSLEDKELLEEKTFSKGM